MVDNLTWEVSPYLIITASTANTQARNLTDPGSNILTSGPHGLWWYEYYAGIKEVLDMTDLVNPHSISIFSSGFAFMMNPNGLVENIYIIVVFKIL